MRRGDRLFEIIQVLRRASGPLTADAIAEQIETSKRTVYRDVAALMGQRVPIRGEAGVGYVLDRGFDLPPLMLTPDEIEAVVLGSQWVVAHADAALARAAVDVLAKVAHILPESLRDVIDDPAVGTPPRRRQRSPEHVDLARLRTWSRQGRKLTIRYVDEAGNESERTIWPFLVGYVTTARVLVAWCELRQNFRLFRTDRLVSVEFREERYPERSATLRRRWLALNEAQHANAGPVIAPLVGPVVASGAAGGRPRRS
jgi:predicted DNA-binding transcriptional regulator YafY